MEAKTGKRKGRQDNDRCSNSVGLQTGAPRFRAGREECVDAIAIRKRLPHKERERFLSPCAATKGHPATEITNICAMERRRLSEPFHL